MMASVVEGYSVHILSKGIAAAGRKAMDDLYARYAAGRGCASSAICRGTGATIRW